MQRRNGSDKKEDGIDLLFLKLFEEGISDFEIFEVLTKINRSIQELNDEVEIPDSFQEFDILDKLLQFFDEKEDETLRKAILTLLQTVIKRNLTEEDEIETIRRIINFCLANIPNETEVDFILSILNSIAVKKKETHDLLIEELKEESFNMISEKVESINHRILVSFFSSLFKYETPKEFLSFITENVIQRFEEDLKAELTVEIVAACAESIELFGIELVNAAAMNMIEREVVNRRVLLSVAYSASLCDKSIVALLLNIAEKFDMCSSTAVVALVQMVEANEENCIEITNNLNVALFIDSPGLVLREVARLITIIIKKLPSSTAELILVPETVTLLLNSLIFEDTELRRNIIKTILHFEKTLVRSLITEENIEVIHEIIEDCNIEEAFALLEE